ncbi:hypothetical protein CGMCC3_g13660 [Colletotrichum fructicola]|nr:uncharacterized protein CGMCC3_g13660 [Colletotrichum fructicola]KAE9570261.1 hypothetical protein CGMCC3_g13660 [Colletotrichum fructicola]
MERTTRHVPSRKALLLADMGIPRPSQKHWFEPGAAHQFFFCDRPALRRSIRINPPALSVLSQCPIVWSMHTSPNNPLFSLVCHSTAESRLSLVVEDNQKKRPRLPGRRHPEGSSTSTSETDLAVDWLDKYLQTSFASWLASAARIGRRLTN